MSEADEGPFRFQDEPDSSPLTSLTATPARPLRTDNSDMEMDLDDWEPGREALVGIPSSSPPQDNVTPRRPGGRQEEDLQGREGQYQRPRRYNMDLLLESVAIPPVADMEIEQGVVEAASHVDMESASHHHSLQGPESQEDARPRAASLEVVTPSRGSILRRFGPGTGLSFPSGVPYSTRYSDYTPPPEDFWRPIFAARPVPPGEDLAAKRDRPVSVNGRARADNVSGPQNGESSRHGQHLDSQTEGVRHHMTTATPGPSTSANTAPNDPQPVTSGHGPASLPQGASRVASVNEVVEVTDTILTHSRDPHRHQGHLRPLAPKPPMQPKDTLLQPLHHTAQEHTQSNDQAQQRFTNMAQFQPLLALPPPIQHPLLLSPFPPRIPGTFTPALLSLAMNPPRSLHLGTTDSLQSYLPACGISLLYNDMYPRALPIPVRREPFNRTVFVEARYLSVIGLLYPRAEFIVSRIAEGVGNEKVEPNSGVMMDKWHVYKAVRMSGEEMQKLGVCAWSEKECGEWEPVVEEQEGREVKRVKMMDGVVDEDEDVEEGEMEEEESDDTVIVSGRARASEKEGKENVRMTVEEELDEACEDMEIVDAEELQTSKTTNRKEKAKEVQVSNNKDKDKEILQENNDSGNVAAPSASLISTSAPAPPRRSTRVQSRQASVEETTTAKSENKITAPPNPNGKTIITRKLRAIQLDETGATITITPNPGSRPTKTPKPRLSTTTTTITTTNLKPPIAPSPTPSHRTPSTHYTITLRQRDYPLGGVARIQCTPQARQVIESIQRCFGVQHPYEIWRHKDYTVHDPDTSEITQRYIKVLRGYAGDENTDDGLMRLFLDEMDQRIRENTKERIEKGKGKDGKDEEEEDGKDMATLEERMAWKERYLELKRRGKMAVERAKGRRREGEDLDMGYDEWLEERHEQEEKLIEKWFGEREGLVEEEELARKTVEFALFEYGGGDGLALGKP